MTAVMIGVMIVLMAGGFFGSGMHGRMSGGHDHGPEKQQQSPAPHEHKNEGMQNGEQKSEEIHSMPEEKQETQEIR
jgi:hypothetical protein